MTLHLNNFGKHHCSMHRSGWPFVHQHMAAAVSTQACAAESATADALLDDFAEASHVYARGSAVNVPWVGIIHHPAKVNSPLRRDQMHTPKRSLGMQPSWRKSVSKLRGVIVLSEELAKYIRAWLRRDVLPLLHPTDLDVKQWDPAAWIEGGRRVHQLGFFLRDTRSAFRTSAPIGWQLSRSSPSHIDWANKRDLALKAVHGAAEFRTDVEELGRLQAPEYDDLLASSVITSWIYGSSANNVVVECMARATPLLVNPLPPVVQYLGRGYPLYCAQPENANQILTDVNVMRAHEYLLGLDRSKLDVASFVKTVLEYSQTMTSK